LTGVEAALEVAEDAARYQRSLKLGILQVMALSRLGDDTGAVDRLSTVLRQAAEEGFARIVLDEGEGIGVVLHALEAKLLRNEAAHVTPLFLDYVRRLSHHFDPAAVAGVENSPSYKDMLLDPLTRKEIRILQLVAEGYSNQAMAEKLFVSDSTVRTHLRNINTKLVTKNRTQAVAVARRLGQIR